MYFLGVGDDAVPSVLTHRTNVFLCHFVVPGPWEIDTASTAPQNPFMLVRGKKKKCRLSVPPFLDRNLHAILSTFAGNDHSEWVMTLMTTLYYTQLVYMSPEGRNKPVYLNSLFLCRAVLTNISFQVLHRLEKRPGQLLWHRSSGGDHFHQRAPGQGEHRPT